MLLANLDWVKWLIPLVVVFVVILSNLARISQEEKKNAPRRRPGPGGDTPPQPRRPTGEVERFLEEINRRRREAAAPPKPAVAQRAPVAPARPVERRTVREVPSAAQEIASVVPAPNRTPFAAPPPAMAMPPRRLPREPVSEPERRKPPQVVEDVVVAAVPVATASGNVTAGAPAAVVTVRPDTPTRVQLRQLLRIPQTLKTAVVLREVLDAPLCRRRPGWALPRRVGG